MVGVCFGHQAMAEALGGKVEKSEKGWGAGLHSYEVVRRTPWMNGETQIAAPASHQDQVVVQPPDTEVTVASAFTPFAGLAWTDRPAISFQFHPEFSPGFAKALIEKRYDIVDVDNRHQAFVRIKPLLRQERRDDRRFARRRSEVDRHGQLL